MLCKVARHMMRSCCEACQNLKHFTSIWPLNLFHFVFRFESFLRYYFRRENRLFSKISQLAKFTSDVFSLTLSFMQFPYVRNKTAKRKEEVDIDDAFKLWCVFLFFYFDVISLLVEVQGQYFIVISLYLPRYLVETISCQNAIIQIWYIINYTNIYGYFSSLYKHLSAHWRIVVIHYLWTFSMCVLNKRKQYFFFLIK